MVIDNKYTLPGTSHPEDWYVVGAHYDSTSEDPYVKAPGICFLKVVMHCSLHHIGAVDNASGVAAVLEMAKIFSEI